MAVDVSPDVFAYRGDSSNEHVIIVGSSDPEAAVRALRRAGDRWMCVTEHGDEIVDAAQLEEVEWEYDPDDPPYSPNYVSDVRMPPRGPVCYVDCKGYISEPMRLGMIAVLVEELEREGVHARVEVPTEAEARWGTEQG